MTPKDLRKKFESEGGVVDNSDPWRILVEMPDGTWWKIERVLPAVKNKQEFYLSDNYSGYPSVLQTLTDFSAIQSEVQYDWY